MKVKPKETWPSEYSNDKVYDAIIIQEPSKAGEIIIHFFIFNDSGYWKKYPSEAFVPAE